MYGGRKRKEGKETGKKAIIYVKTRKQKRRRRKEEEKEREDMCRGKEGGKKREEWRK